MQYDVKRAMKRSNKRDEIQEIPQKPEHQPEHPRKLSAHGPKTSQWRYSCCVWNTSTSRLLFHFPTSTSSPPPTLHSHYTPLPLIPSLLSHPLILPLPSLIPSVLSLLSYTVTVLLFLTIASENYV
jgi:hypothetical protein